MNDSQLLRAIFKALEVLAVRARITQRRTARMEKRQMALADDMAALKTAVAALIAAFQKSQTDVAAQVAAAVAADEAGTDVDVKALADSINAAMQPVAPAVAAATTAMASSS